MGAVLRLVVALVVFAMPLTAAQAEEPTKPRRIGVLWPVSDDPELEAFRQRLRELGHVGGRNVAIEYRYAQGNDALLPHLATDLARNNVDVIVTWGVTAARAAMEATSTIPIVNGSMSDPVRAKLIASLARPGGNLTGLTSSTPELSAKRLELITEALPGLSRVGVLSTAAPTALLGLEETETAARALGLQLSVRKVREPSDFDGAYSAIADARARAVIVLADLLFMQHRHRLIDLEARHRLPTVYFSRDFVDAGGFISYAPNFPDMFRRAAEFVDKILRGTKPGDIPVEQPTKFDLIINLTTARALGLNVPPTLLARADEVIE